MVSFMPTITASSAFRVSPRAQIQPRLVGFSGKFSRWRSAQTDDHTLNDEITIPYKRPFDNLRRYLRMSILAPLAGIASLGYGSYQLADADEDAPIAARFYDASGKIAPRCQLTVDKEVNCDGWKRGHIEGGKAYNALWQVGKVSKDGTLQFDIYDGPQINIGKVNADGTIIVPKGKPVGKVVADSWNDLSKEEKGAAAILVMRDDSNDGPKEMFADALMLLLEALADGVEEADDE
jgi:hypothetical protein